MGRKRKQTDNYRLLSDIKRKSWNQFPPWMNIKRSAVGGKADKNRKGL
jgi:hypothetical protein